MTMMAMEGDETDTDSSPETSMGSLLGRASACEAGWKSVVSKLLYLIKLRSRSRALRRFIEHDNVDRLLLPLRRQPARTPNSGPSSSLVARQAATGLEDGEFERSRCEPRKVEKGVQSQTTYKWWWTSPRFVPLPDHSHGCW